MNGIGTLLNTRYFSKLLLRSEVKSNVSPKAN